MKLSDLDKEIVQQLNSLRDLYMTAKDEGMLSGLNELKSLLKRKSEFPLEEQTAVILKDRDDRLQRNSSLTEEQALKAALSEDGVEEQLIENGMSREDFNSFSSKLDEMTERIVAGFSDTKQGFSDTKKDLSEIKEMLANQPANGAAASAEEPAAGNHVCVAIHPAPSLVAQQVDKLGDNFHKNVMMQQLGESLKASFAEKALRACISSTDYGTIRNELEKQPECLIYLGTGVGFEAPDSGTSQRQILVGTCKLPPFVVVCLKYGAKETAQRLVGCAPAGDSVKAVVYIRVDVHEKMKVLCQNVIPELLKCLLVDSFNFDGLRDALGRLIDALKLCKADFGILPGRALSAGAAICSMKLLAEKGGPNVTLEPEDPFARNNVLRMVRAMRELLLSSM